MGGKAITKYVQSTRLTKSEFTDVTSCVMATITSAKDPASVQHYSGLVHAAPTKAFASKDSFGDLDVLIGFDQGFDRASFEHYFNDVCNAGNVAIVKNGPTSSFAWELADGAFFQIDLTYTQAEDFAIGYNYHGNGDLGNFLGRIYHTLGLKFGHRGLIYTHMNGSYVVGEITLSNNFDEILAFIGLDSADAVFDSNEDVYDFVMSSPFFSEQAFLFANRNHAARTRDSKRPSYNGFLQYIADNNVDRKPLAGADYAIVAINHFGKMNEFIDLMTNEAKRVAAKAALNASFISQVSGLTGIELGDLMKTIKHHPEFSLDSVMAKGFTQTRADVVGFIDSIVRS